MSEEPDGPPETPIVVNADPMGAQLASTVRTVIQLVGMWLVSRGYGGGGDVEFAAGVAAIVVPWAYNQWRIRRVREKLAALVNFLPDHIARFK